MFVRMLKTDKIHFSSEQGGAMEEKKCISVVIPAYNEEDCVDELALRLQRVFSGEKEYHFEVIIVENGSTDKTWEKLLRINASDSRFKLVQLSRNFRMDGGITAGLEYAKGDACVLMTADLQDPPEMISKFLREWENGWENIYGVVTRREGTNFLRRINSSLFYRIASILSDGRIPRNASDFRLVDKKVYTAVREMRERNRFVRGLFAWAGFRSKGLEMERPPRFGGSSNANTFAVLDLAIKGIFAHTYKPLKLITLTGLLLSAISLVILGVLVILWITRGVPFAGYGSIMAVLLLLISFLFLLLGILGEYLGLIYEEAKQRPNFVVSDSVGF
jgi:polyisoprenyl-phosphate glycosyltransferase